MDRSPIEWPKLSQKSYYAIFRTVDDYPITFHFHLDDDNVKKRFEELVKSYGGDIVDKYNDMSPYTALMVEDMCESAFSNRVSFRASYIIECINDGILLNINFYVQTNDVAKFKVNDYMKVIYLREATFTADKIGPINQDGTSSSSNNVTVSKPVINSKLTADKAKTYQSNLYINRKLNRNASGSKSITKNRRKKEMDFRRSPSSNPEYESIEKPDVESSEINKCLNPCAHCILHMDRKSYYFNVDRINKRIRSQGSRSFSISREKERRNFRRELTKRNRRKYAALSIEKCKVIKDVDEKECSTPENVRREECSVLENVQREECSVPENVQRECSALENIQREECSVPENVQREECSVPENVQRECSAPENVQRECSAPENVQREECSVPKNIRRSIRTRRKRINIDFIDNSDLSSHFPSSDSDTPFQCYHSDTSSQFPSCEESSPKDTRLLMCARKINAQIFSDDEDDMGCPYFAKEVDIKHSRYPYSRAEKEAILRYIVKKEAYHTVGGANLWKKMELSNICPRRTWMSLQNHFKRCLIKELEKFQFLTKYQINLLRGY